MPDKKTVSSVQKPPYLPLAEALRHTEEIHQNGAGSVSLESLSALLRNSVKSSSFRLKLNALRNFGLVEERGDTVSLTPLGLQYSAPTSPTERAAAAALAMQRIGMAQKLHSRFAGGILPSTESLANTLLREYSAPVPLNTAWAEFFVEALRTADLVSQVGGRTTVRRQPTVTAPWASGASLEDTEPSADALSDSSSIAVPSRSGESHRTTAASGPPDGDVQRVDFTIANGARASILIPTSATADDLDDLISLISVMRKRAARSEGAGKKRK
jgi:hypothetical protein